MRYNQNSLEERNTEIEEDNRSLAINLKRALEELEEKRTTGRAGGAGEGGGVEERLEKISSRMEVR